MSLRTFIYRWYTALRTPKAATIPFTELTRPLHQLTVAIVTTAGVRLQSQLDFAKRGSDHSFRIIPGEVDPAELVPDHTHYNTESALADIDSVFPIRTLTTLLKAGFIGGIAPIHIGFMGYIPDTDPLVKESMPAVIRHLKNAGVGAVILSPG